MKKSNIFAYTELRKLVENLNESEHALKENIATQSAYFHILDPKYFSDDLAPEWKDIRDQLGYSSERGQQGQLLLKHTMMESIQALTEAECREILTRLKGVFESLSREFSS